MFRASCCEICDRNPYCGIDCGSCHPDDVPDYGVEETRGGWFNFLDGATEQSGVELKGKDT